MIRIKDVMKWNMVCMPSPSYIQSRLAIMRLAITRIGYNAVGRGPQISAARGKLGTTANNNAVINWHLFL